MVLGLVVLGQACISVSIFKDMKSDNYSQFVLSNIIKSIQKLLCSQLAIDFTNLQIKTNVSVMIILTPKIILNNHIIKHSIDKQNRKKTECIRLLMMPTVVYFQIFKRLLTLNHTILLSKLNTTTLEDCHTTKLFQSYLMNQTQFFKVIKKSSNVLPVQ